MGNPTTDNLVIAPTRRLSYGWNSNNNAIPSWNAGWDSTMSNYTPTTGFPSSYWGEPSITVPGGSRGFLSTMYAEGIKFSHILAADLIWVSTAVIDTVGSTSLTVGTLPSRDRNGGTAGVGLDMFAVHANGSPAVSTASTFTASYTNSAGAAGRTASFSPTVSGTSAGRTLLRASLQAGDFGVRSVDSVTFAGTANGSSWHFGLLRVLKYNPSGLPSGDSGAFITAPLKCLAEVYDGTVLWPILRWGSSAGSAIGGCEYEVKVV